MAAERHRLVAWALLGCACAREGGSEPDTIAGAGGVATSAAGVGAKSGQSGSAAAGASAGFGGLATGSLATGGASAAVSGAAGTAGVPSGSGSAGLAGADNRAGSGAGGGGGNATCAGLLCEDFEQGQVDSAKWDTQAVAGATVKIQSDRAAHGKYAAQVHALATPSGGAATAYAYLLTKQAPPALATHNFGRAYFFTTPAPHSNNIGLVFGGTTGFPKPTYLSIAEHSQSWQFGFIKLSGSPSGERQVHESQPMPVMTWACLEWEFNDQADQIKVWVDGTGVGSFDSDHIDYPAGHVPGDPIFNGQSRGLIGAFAQFGFGVYDWHPGGFDYDFYYDDIVLDVQRVGCL